MFFCFCLFVVGLGYVVVYPHGIRIQPRQCRGIVSVSLLFLYGCDDVIGQCAQRNLVTTAPTYETKGVAPFWVGGAPNEAGVMKLKDLVPVDTVERSANGTPL